MAFDENLILHGKGSGGALVDCDENDDPAILTEANEDGNIVVDLKKTGIKGLDAVLFLTEEADTNAYDDEAAITIEASDELDRNWETVVTFPTLHFHIRKIPVIATVAGWVVADITKSCKGGTTTHTGELLAFDEALKTVGGTGFIYVEMDTDGDLFDDVDEQIEMTTGSGTGNGHATGAATELTKDQMAPGVYVRRFTTDKRYVRCNCEALDGNIGLVWILLTNHAAVKL